MDRQSYIHQTQNQQEQNVDNGRTGMELAALAAAAGQTHPQQPPRTCPRCNSTNTKFCYFNNYSLSQPRYFCKGCRRYWTHGGTLRNVPVGGSSRKSKRPRSSSSSASTAPAVPPSHVPAIGEASSVSSSSALTSGLAPVMMSPNHFPFHDGVRGGGFLSSLVAGQSMALQPPVIPNMGNSSSNLSLLQGHDFGAFGRRELPGWHQSFIGGSREGNAPPAGVAGAGAQFWTIGGASSSAGGGGGGSASNPNQWPNFPAGGSRGAGGGDE